MLANMESASYDATTGQVNIIMKNTTINGYQNTVNQYQDANTLSVPLPGNIVNLDMQAKTQMQVTGYQSTIIDENYTILPGEFTSYSPNWYVSTRVAGVEVQEANTANKENLMAGQSTNGVLSDIMQLLVDIVNYLETHTHSGVTTGSGSSGTPVEIPPDGSSVVSDQSYIGADHNLFITGTYEPK